MAGQVPLEVTFLDYPDLFAWKQDKRRKHNHIEGISATCPICTDRYA